MNTKKYLRDDIAGIIFTDESLKEYIVSVISATTKIKKEDVEDIKLLTPRVNSNTNIKYSEVDAIYENKENIINIEVNYNESKIAKRKNNRYVYHLILRQIKKGRMDKYKKVWQININNYDYFKKGEFVYNSYVMEEKYHKKRDDRLEIIDVNLEFLETVSYNEVKEEKANSLKRLLYILMCEDKKQREELYGEDKIMDKVNNKIEELTEEFDSELFYNKEEFRNEVLYDLGQKEGIEKEKKEIAKNLIKMAMPLEDVVKVTGLSREEIEELKANS